MRMPDNHASTEEYFSFGSFRLYPAARVLWDGSERVKLGSRAFDILLTLATRAGEIVSQRELMAAAWPNLHVEEVSLRVHMAALRKALEKKPGAVTALMNVPGRGYSFVAPISRDREAVAAPVVTVDPLASVYRLPTAPTHMVGRQDDVRAILEALRRERLVTIVGPGGMGKSTVALAAAHSLVDTFDRRVCFVELGSLKESTRLSATIASALGISVPSDDPVPQIVAHVSLARTLLVLDCLEHSLFDAASVVERLLGEVKNLRILATSREAMRTANEFVYRLPPLPSPPERARLTSAEALTFPAVQLFVQHAVRSGGLTQLSDADAEPVARVCRRLDGIALAIELAAGRVGGFGIEEIAAGLDGQFALQWPGRRTAPPRHQTLKATMDWSYELLSQNERSVLARLSTFVGRFTLEAARSVAGYDEIDPELVYDAVSELFAKSLASADLSQSPTRYRLLDTTRAYAAAKLADAGETAKVRRRHAEYHRELLGLAFGGTKFGADSADIEDIRAALQWAFGADGDSRIAIDLAGYSGPIWLGRALMAECQSWMAQGAALAEARQEVSPQYLSIKWCHASAELLSFGMSEESAAAWTKTVDLAKQLGGVPQVLDEYLWAREIRETLFDSAMATALRCAAAVKDTDDPAEHAFAEWIVGHTKHHLGKHAEAQAHLQRSIDLDTEDGRMAQIRGVGYDRRVDAMVISADSLWNRGFPEQAQRLAADAVEEARSLGFALPIGVALMWEGFTSYFADPDTEALEQRMVELAERGRSLSIASDLGFALGMLGLCEGRRGHVEPAWSLVIDGIEKLSEAHLFTFNTAIMAQLAEMLLGTKRHNDARTLMERVDREERNPEHWCTPEILRIKAAVALWNGDEAFAETALLNSIAMAQAHGSLSWELKSNMSLSRLRLRQHRAAEAAPPLAHVYGRFTEGFETIDLIGARSLLNELS
jgi:predicted ATPase/DNA-binding winged helix-turn-helix (wHTH) protein